MSVLLSLLPIFVAGTNPADRVYRRLDSGASIVVESRGGEIASVQLFAASRACPESASLHGHRHLLEHLLAKGKDGRLGERLEREGWSISAETYRDFMVFRMTGLASRWERASEAISEILAGWPHQPEALATESLIIEQEIAILGKEVKLSAMAWIEAYGGAGLDPIGTLETIASATPESLAALHARQFARNQLTVSVCGPVDSSAVIEKFSKVLGAAPKAIEARWTRVGEGRGGVVKTANGTAAFLPAGSYSTSETAALVGLACLLGMELDQGFITYTPSQSPGLVIVGTVASDDSGVLRQALQRISPDLALIKELALRWAKTRSLNVSACAWWNGVFQVQATGGKADLFLAAIDNLSPADLDSAYAKLKSAIEGGGF